MRIWDIPVEKLCRNHLLGEHRELHAMWVVITQNKKGYSKHPETIRWIGKLRALYLRHKEQVNEMKGRGYNHQSPLDVKNATGESKQDVYVDTPLKQIKILKEKGCNCKV
ncbi:MAG: pyrimidine dimer DNA glycosylase [Nitrosopumilus sp.]|nr:pyrimidine dimer DNA glycosylase [Nitrosopumilus sp.]MBL7015675.1 pyrimidine dimer DNA glycosylase [Nitrosopumilus sp.]MBL7018547.1 pyrimidine dimer DNA glycosylase [Nitrosopumilus sp.]